ncbi:MAG: hypothetical protein PVJ07_09890, partial [Anaerolineales bacterium]
VGRSARTCYLTRMSFSLYSRHQALTEYYVCSGHMPPDKTAAVPFVCQNPVWLSVNTEGSPCGEDRMACTSGSINPQPPSESMTVWMGGITSMRAKIAYSLDGQRGVAFRPEKVVC